MKTEYVREVHEIELSSVCNLACKYCPHPKLMRAKAHMSLDIFELALEHVRYYCERGTQTELSLTGIGEAVLHPNFAPMLERARNVIGNRPLVLATNGVAMTRELAELLARVDAIVYVSSHRPEKAGVAWRLLREAGVRCGVNTAFVDDSIDWAGQVNWHASARARECDYLKRAWAVIRQDGAVNACCMDAHSKYPLATVHDLPGTWRARPIDLCAACHLTVPAHFVEAA